MPDAARRPPGADHVLKLLLGVLRLPAQVDAFLTTQFSDVLPHLAPGASISEKLTTLLRCKEAGEVYDKLGESFPEEVQWAERGPAGGIASPLILSAGLRQRALDIVHGVSFPRPALLDAYLASAPPGQEYEFARYQGDDLLKRMLLKLSTALQQSDGTHPLLTFAWSLVKIASAWDAPAALLDATGPLSDWFHDAAAHMRIEGAAIEQMKRRVEDDFARKGDRELFLVLVVAESAKEQGRYAVRAFRVLVSPSKGQWTDEDVEPIGEGGSVVCSLDELPALVNELIHGLSGDLTRANDQLTVELFVPLKLLSCNADQWSFDNGMVLSVLGAEYRVNVRSWDRAYNPRCAPIVPKWHAKWERLCASPKGALWRCDPASIPGHDAAQRAAPGEEAVCMALGFVPAAEASGGASPLLRKLIGSGTPVALWPRDASCDGAGLQRFLVKTTAHEDVHALRHEVQRLRQEALAVDDRDRHPGSHLSLLWDDPNKLPPDATGRARLTSPLRASRRQASQAKDSTS